MEDKREKATGPIREQVRAARALLNAKQERLAFLAGIGLATLKRFEGGRDTGGPQRDAIRRALEAAGVGFMAAGSTALGVLPGAGAVMRTVETRSPVGAREDLVEAQAGVERQLTVGIVDIQSRTKRSMAAAASASTAAAELDRGSPVYGACR